MSTSSHSRSRRSRFLAALLALLACLPFLTQCAHTTVSVPPPMLRLEDKNWTTRDGRQLPYLKWPGAPQKPEALLLCIHGLSGAADDFNRLGETLPGKGYACYGMELRGQGHDPNPRARGDIGSCAQWIDDLRDFTLLLRKKHPGVPVIWYGESLGALITIQAASICRPEDGVAGIVLASPVVALRENLQLPFFKNLAVRTLMLVWPGFRISLESLGNSEVQVTSETTHREQMEKTTHYVKDFTIRLFREVERMIRTSLAAARQITLPTLVLYTPNDALTSREGVEKFYDTIAAKDKNKLFFPNSHHLILHDVDRWEAVGKVTDWLKRVGTAGK